MGEWDVHGGLHLSLENMSACWYLNNGQLDHSLTWLREDPNGLPCCPSSGKAVCTSTPIQTLCIPSSPVVGQPPELYETSPSPPFLQKALEDTILLRAPALLTALFFLLLSFSAVYIPLHSLSIVLHRFLVVALLLGSVGPYDSVLFTQFSIACCLIGSLTLNRFGQKRL